METRDEMLARLRKKMEERGQGRRDPDIFMPGEAKDGERLEWFFRVLPPLVEGETCKTGTAPKTLEFWFYENGAHYLSNGRERHECPRIHDGEECPLCQVGFELMEDNDDKEYRKKVAKQYLPRSYYSVNVYFLNTDKNPEALRGRVMCYNMPKTVFDIMQACVDNDNTGDEQDPKAAGIFFHPTEGGYTFKLVAEKQGEYNSYKQSMFLPASFGALVKLADSSPDMARIQTILNLRHWLPSKYKARDLQKLNDLIAKLQQSEVGGGTHGGTEEIGGTSQTTAAIANKPVAAPVRKPAAALVPAQSVVEENVEESPTLGTEVSDQTPTPAPKPAVAPKPAPKPAVTSASKPVLKPTALKQGTAIARPVVASSLPAQDPDLMDLLKDIQQ